jgi:hypothetical protein
MNFKYLTLVFGFLLSSWAHCEKCQGSLTFQAVLKESNAQHAIVFSPAFKTKVKKLYQAYVNKKLGHTSSREERKKFAANQAKRNHSVYISFGANDIDDIINNHTISLGLFEKLCMSELARWLKASPYNRFAFEFGVKHSTAHNYLRNGKNYIAFPFSYLQNDILPAEYILHELTHAKEYLPSSHKRWKKLLKFYSLQLYFWETRGVRAEFAKNDRLKISLKPGSTDYDYQTFYPLLSAFYALYSHIHLDQIKYYTNDIFPHIEYAKSLGFKLENDFLLKLKLKDFQYFLNNPSAEFLLVLYESLRIVKEYREDLLISPLFFNDPKLQKKLQLNYFILLILVLINNFFFCSFLLLFKQ